MGVCYIVSVFRLVSFLPFKLLIDYHCYILYLSEVIDLFNL